MYVLEKLMWLTYNTIHPYKLRSLASRRSSVVEKITEYSRSSMWPCLNAWSEEHVTYTYMSRDQACIFNVSNLLGVLATPALNTLSTCTQSPKNTFMSHST